MIRLLAVTLGCALAVVPRSLQPAAAQPAAVQPAAAQPAAIKLIQSVCGGCHASSSILGEHRTRSDWKDILAWMSDEGAVMTDDEYDRIVGFLGVQYGLVAINTAAPDEVRAVLELTAEQAERLAAARKSGSVIRTLDDLSRAIDVPAESLAARADRIDFD